MSGLPWHNLYLERFTPAEAEALSGVAVALQRDWRRRNLLPQFEGTGVPRHGPHVVLQLWVLRFLGDRGITLQQAREFSVWASVQILWHALQRKQAYSGDHARVLEWAPPDVMRRMKQPKATATAEQLQLYALTYGYKDLSTVDWLWEHQADWLARQIWAQKGVLIAEQSYVPPRFAVWWADGSYEGVTTLDWTYEGFSVDPKFEGATVVIDFAAAATTFLTRVGRPIASISFQTKHLEPSDAIERIAHLRNPELVAHGRVQEVVHPAG